MNVPNGDCVPTVHCERGGRRRQARRRCLQLLVLAYRQNRVLAHDRSRDGELERRLAHGEKKICDRTMKDCPSLRRHFYLFLPFFLMFEEERKEKEARQSVTFLQKMDRPRGYGESLRHDQTTCAPRNWYRQIYGTRRRLIQRWFLHYGAIAGTEPTAALDSHRSSKLLFLIPQLQSPSEQT